MRRRNRPIVIETNVLYSDAWWTLKVHAIRVLLIFYTKRHLGKKRDSKGNMRYPILNNGDIVFTYREALEKYGMVGKKFCGAIDDLVAKGFVEITYQGTGPGDPSTYMLCDRWQQYGTENFKSAPQRRKRNDPNGGWNIHNARNK
jgi:hypothetical protein